MRSNIGGYMVRGIILSFIIILSPLSSQGFVKGDVNNDNQIGLQETIYSLQVGAGLVMPLSETTINVPGDIPTIQQAIDAASDGDTINIALGTYTEALTITRKALIIKGAGSASTIIDAGGANGFSIENSPGVVIENLTVQGGNRGIDAGRNSSIQINQIIVKDCADNGILIDESSTALLQNCTVENSGNHGIWVFHSNIYLLENIVCTNNNRYGIGIFNSSSAVIFGAIVTTNSNDRGIQVYNSSGLTSVDSTITANNNSRGSLIGNASSLSLTNSTLTFENNTSRGLQLVGTSSVYTAPDTSITIRNSGRGFEVFGSSYAEITGSLLVENMGVYGIFVGLNSGIEVGDPAVVTVSSSASDGVGIFIVDSSVFNAQDGSLTVENNLGDGIKALRDANFRAGELSITRIVNNGGRGIFAREGINVNCTNAEITGNTGGDVVLRFGSRASLYGGPGTIGSISCDGTVLSRGDYVCP